LKDITEKIIAYEDGALNNEEVIKLFQVLIDTGKNLQDVKLQKGYITQGVN